MSWQRTVGVLGLIALGVGAMAPGCGSGDTAQTGFMSASGGASGEGGTGGSGGTSGGSGSSGSAGSSGSSGATAGGASGSSGASAGSSGAAGSSQGHGPPYPIVLAHGFFGTDKFAGLDFITYFYQVKDHLGSIGETEVFTPAVDPFNTSELRGQQLAAKVEEILAQTGAAKVNIIGHSQGGLDARVVANLLPGRVASIATISTPHHGSPVSDLVLKLISDPNAQAILDALVNVIGAAIYDAQGNGTSVFTALKQFSTPDITAFNNAHPDEPDVKYFSVAGRSLNHDGVPFCTPDAPVSFTTSWDFTKDPIDPLLSVTASFLKYNNTFNYANDGMVRVQDAKWGKFLGCVPADHIDEVGHLFADSPGAGNDWNYMDFYVQLVAYIRAQGF